MLMLVLPVATQAQDKALWSLEKCINYALKNSLSVQQSDLAVLQAALTKKQAFWAQTPSLNGNFSHGINFGRSIDPTSYSFINQINQSSSLSLNLSQPIFRGLQIRNTINQSKVDLEAAQKDVDKAKKRCSLIRCTGLPIYFTCKRI
jgi:outer membrane protein